MKLKSMLLALSLIGSTSFVLANDDTEAKKESQEVVVAEEGETAEEKPSCGCPN